ncbi:aminotransferase class V-fold PLP-dependent enzyme [Lacibacterium aquatile]|uniref:Aminotransferase class V-fold PLP-dependent enzyme n=1 Tax=Lacibacterium aquatile TaxID=1168082 RepID=A0ABW5DKZ7_9PROT
MTTLIPSQRQLFDIPEDIAYLNSAYMGASPRPVVEAGNRASQRKAMPWQITPADFFTDSEKARSLFARMINAGADDIALVPAVSYGMAVAAKVLPIKSGQRILTLIEQFPSNVYPWQDLARRKGAECVSLPRPADDDWTSVLLSAIDAQTAILAVPHCHWTDGGLVDLVAVGEACRKVGAALCIDATQSMGVLPFDVQQIQPDFVAVGGYKWLLGPYSYGYLYVAKRWQEAEPLEETWLGRRYSEDFSGLVNYREDYQPGARRFDAGGRSNFALTPPAIAALELMLGWGADNLSATFGARNDAIAARMEERFGLKSVPRHRRAPHYLGLRFPGEVPADLPAKLAAAKVYVSVRGKAMRVTPHVWTTEGDVERLFEVMGQALG